MVRLGGKVTKYLGVCGKVPYLTHTVALIHTHVHVPTHHKQRRLGNYLFHYYLLVTKMDM